MTRFTEAESKNLGFLGLETVPAFPGVRLAHAITRRCNAPGRHGVVATMVGLLCNMFLRHDLLESPRRISAAVIL